jgi:hypothetical protein
MPRAVVVVERGVVPTAETIVSPMVNDAHVSVAIQGQIACEGQIFAADVRRLRFF